MKLKGKSAMRTTANTSEGPHEKYERLIARRKSLTPVPCAVAHPCDEISLRGAVEIGQLDLFKPIIGPAYLPGPRRLDDREFFIIPAAAIRLKVSDTGRAPPVRRLIGRTRGPSAKQ